MPNRPPKLTPDMLATLHRRQEEAIKAARASSPPPLEGTGTVMVAGGGQAFTNAWVALSILRYVQQSGLPVQVWHLGSVELNPTMRALLQRFDEELVDAFEIRRRHPMRRLGPWECKAYALLHSPFRHVILTDADTVPLVDRAVMLRSAKLAETGAVFWPDNQSHLPESPVWELFDVPYREEREVESVQLMFHHRTGAKWSLHGVNPTTGRAELDRQCLGVLDELRSL